jgi:hypothetical protein
MTDDKGRPGIDEQSEQAKPEQGSRQILQHQANTTNQPDRSVGPGRKPLFRN